MDKTQTNRKQDPPCRSSSTTSLPCWNVRPCAFQKYNTHPRTTSVSTLMECYYKDSLLAHQAGVHIPKKRSALRTCQWNVHFFDDRGASTQTTATAMVKALIETNADVMVLNEFGGYADCNDLGRECALYLLREVHGYHVCVANGDFPTAICTKLHVMESSTFALDRKRHAVGVQVYIDAATTGCSSIVDDDDSHATTNIGNSARATPAPNAEDSTTTNCLHSEQHDRNENTKQDSHTMWFYGTHLEDCDHHGGRYRRDEMKVLLEQTMKSKNSVMLMGDFNQQRQQDYFKEEWNAIVENKQARESPLDDGVSSLLQDAGYSCIWDHAQPYGENSTITTNWNHAESPPPSTHWSGTIVDYCYIKDDRLELTGVYVSPNDLSDHRLIVCDWNI